MGSQFNVESRPGITIQRGIMTRGHNSTWNLDPGHNSTWNHDPGSQFNVELWTGVTIQRGVMTPGQFFTLNYDPGHSSTLNCNSNPGLQLNVESWLGVTIQRGIKTLVHYSTWNKDPGHNSTGGPNFIRRRGRNTMTPVSGGRNSTWKIRWILSIARWIKTPRVEIQWGQNSILHRPVYYVTFFGFLNEGLYAGVFFFYFAKFVFAELNLTVKYKLVTWFHNSSWCKGEGQFVVTTTHNSVCLEIIQKDMSIICKSSNKQNICKTLQIRANFFN